MRRKQPLIVPIRDRRQRRRYLTLRNFRNVLIVATVLFLAVTIYSELRGPRSGDYGRLYSSELPPVPTPKPMSVVREAVPHTVEDHTHADPTLVEPMAREQWLHTEASATTTVPAVTGAPIVTVQTPRAGDDVTISGGPEGLVITRGQRRREVLAGGFGRQTP
jgi:hypothetical protein